MNISTTNLIDLQAAEILQLKFMLKQFEWQPIETCPDEEVERFHSIHNCVMTVKKIDAARAKYLYGYKTSIRWLESSMSTGWPELSFLPFWRPISPPPPATPKGE